jgi:signal peptidase I
LLFPVLLGLALFAFDFPRTGSDEMAPNLRKGDLLLACRLCGGPDRGDVVVFSSPDQKGELSIRRIVGAPGDRVEVRRGEVFVNGIPLVDAPETDLKLKAIDGAPSKSFSVVRETVGGHQFRAVRDANLQATSNRAPQMLDDEYFLVADRRTTARDSRDYGPVRARDVRSRVLRVLHAGDGDAGRQRAVP